MSVTRRFVLHPPPDFLQVFHRSDPERNLVDVIETEILRAAGHQCDLVMIFRVPTREHDIGVAHLAAIGYGKTEHARVEIFHFRQIVHVEADMAHAQAARAAAALACKFATSAVIAFSP
jgi:hypothetical protein